MLFTFYHMVLFQVITRRRIPSSHQEEMGWKEGPPCHLSVARQTLITQVSSLSRGQRSPRIPQHNRMALGLISGRNRGVFVCVCACVCVYVFWGNGAALAELKWLQLLENRPWGRRASGNGCCLHVARKSQQTCHCNGRFLQDLGVCKSGRLICKLTHQTQTFQTRIKYSSGTTVRGDKAVKARRLRIKGENRAETIQPTEVTLLPAWPPLPPVPPIPPLMHQAVWPVSLQFLRIPHDPHKLITKVVDFTSKRVLHVHLLLHPQLLAQIFDMNCDSRLCTGLLSLSAIFSPLLAPLPESLLKAKSAAFIFSFFASEN